MEIKLKIDDIDYGALAAALLPQLKNMLGGRTDPVSKMLSGIAMLPPALIKTTINALPQEAKDDMVKYLINAKKDTILAAAEKFAESKHIPIRFSGLSID